MPLMREIKAFPVPKQSVAIWWLGQNGYSFKTPEGTLAGVDLYLTDSCAHFYQQVKMQFIGPHPSCDVFDAEGVESGRIVPAWPSCEIEFRDIKITGTFALPTDDTDLNHMGFVFQFGSGPKIYVTGDTDDSDLLYSVVKHSPDVLITVINGGFNDLSHWEAAQLARAVRPKVAIPCHYDMFPDNAVDPRQFQAALKVNAPDVRYRQLEHGEPFVFSAEL